MRKPRVIVVGGGPSGGACALGLARTGRFSVQVLDKSRYPRIKVCGSGLSPHALEMLQRLGIRDRFAARRGVIDTLMVRGPAGGEVRVASGIEAWVVPRVELDAGILRAAGELGVELHEDTKVLALLRDGAGQVAGVRTEAGELEADLVVCADGSPSRFSTDPRPKTTIRTLMGWWRGTPWDGRTAHMIWDRRLAGYYAWMFPEPDGVVNIGLTIPESAPEAARLKPLFQALLDEHWGEGLRRAEPVGKWMGHPAVITTGLGPIVERRAIWAGEAARLVSPGSVEGISFALESGITAAATIAGGLDVRGAAPGLSWSARAAYRARTAAHVLPKFWAGEAVARAARQPWARELGRRVVEGRGNLWINQALGTMLGDSRPTA